MPWLLFLAFPVADLVTTPRPVLARAVATGALAAFTIAYLIVFSRVFVRGCPRPVRELVLVAVLGTGLAVWLGPTWAGLLIYVSAAAAGSLPERWVWPAVAAAAGICTVVVAVHGLFADLFILPLLCLLTAFALRGTRYLLRPTPSSPRRARSSHAARSRRSDSGSPATCTTCWATASPSSR